MTFTWRHVLYRLYDGAGQLLYVGITNSINTRFKDHADEKAWWPEVATCRVEFLPDRTALERAEREAIWYERPRHNMLGLLTRPTAPTRPLRQRMSDDEWAWIHGLPPCDSVA